jgi:tartrate dehydrogenase/decarboxylase/D-malate dehydrogenase
VEGEYSEIGGRLGRGIPDELAVQEAVFTRKGATRVVEYAYTLAESRGNYGRHQCLIRGTTACGS